MNTSLTGRAEGVVSSGLSTGWTSHLLKTSLPVLHRTCGGSPPSSPASPPPGIAAADSRSLNE